MALKQAGFVVVRLSQMVDFRANIKSALEMLSGDPPRKEEI